MKFSVIVPTWNEGQQIAAAMRRLREISDSENMELILVDGGSSDNTVEAARKYVDVVESLPEPNRGAQLDAGARKATGDLLFFLHADTQPPGDWQERLEQFWLATHRRPPAATVFSVDYGSGWNFRLVAWGQNLRVGWRQIAYGDAGFCTTRENYEACGGFPHIPLMEDVVFSRRLSKLGPIVRLPEKIHPGARRLHRLGPLRNSLRNAWIRGLYGLGVKPQTLWRWYYSAALREPSGVRDGEKALKKAVRDRLPRGHYAEPFPRKKDD